MLGLVSLLPVYGMLDNDFTNAQAMEVSNQIGIGFSHRLYVYHVQVQEFPGVVRIYDNDFQVIRCSGVFVSPAVVLTAGECVLAIESRAFADGIRLPSESQPNLIVQDVKADGTYTNVAKLTDSVYHFHGPSAGWNVGIFSVRFEPGTEQYQSQLHWYPTLQSSVVSM